MSDGRTRLVRIAAEEPGNCDANAIARFLRGVGYDGMAGLVLSMDRGNRDDYAEIARLRQRLQVYEPVRPAKIGRAHV